MDALHILYIQWIVDINSNEWSRCKPISLYIPVQCEACVQPAIAHPYRGKSNARRKSKQCKMQKHIHTKERNTSSCKSTEDEIEQSKLHLYWAYTINYTQATRGRSAENFFHLWTNSRDGPAPRPTPQSNKGTTPTPHMGSKLTHLQIQWGRMGKNKNRQASSSLCTCPGCPRQQATGLQLAHTVNNKH